MQNPNYEYLETTTHAIKTLRSLKPGESYVYFVGYLDGERLTAPFGGNSMIAAAAYELMQQGYVHLTQKRVGPPMVKNGIIDWKLGQGGGFRYIATGAQPKKKPMSVMLPPIITMGNKP